MPQRKIVFANNEYYHVFNRSINKEPIFVKQRNCDRAVETLNYYRFENPPIRLSYLLSFGPDKRREITDKLAKDAKKLVEIVCFVLMPNHFHFLLKQNLDDGISTFLALFQNSYTRYFNTKNERQGHLFQGQFKGVRIEDDEQFLHVNRYIHLNPYTSYVVSKFEELEKYPYSSLPDYLSKDKSQIWDKEIISPHFPTSKQYRKFLFDQADYQRELERIKHLILE